MVPLNWISPSDLFIIQPKSPEEVDALADDLMPLVRLLPQSVEWLDSYIDNIRDYPHYLTLIYHEDRPVAFIQNEDNEGFDSLGKDSLEFSGAVLPEYRDKGLTMQVSP